MDRTGIIVVALCAVLLFLWFHEKQEEYSHLPPPPVNTNTVAATPTTTATPTSGAPAPAAGPVSLFDTNKPEALLVITNARARYTFTSRGGGLKAVELLDYPETVSARWKKKAAKDGVATLNQRAPFPVLAIWGRVKPWAASTAYALGATVIDTNGNEQTVTMAGTSSERAPGWARGVGSTTTDGTVTWKLTTLDILLVGDGNFTLARTDDGIRAEKSLANGLRLTKEFHLSSNYLINASVRLENTSTQTLTLPAQEWVIGTATPMGPDDTSKYYLGAMWFDGVKMQDCAAMYFNTNTTFMGTFRRTPTTEYHAGAGNVVWAAAHNQFFALLAMPKQPAQEMIARPVPLPAFPNVEQEPDAPLPQGVQTMLVYPAQTLTANSNLVRSIVFFAGPKEYRTLALIGEQFQNRADLVMNFGTGFASFWGIGSFFAKILLVAMNSLHDLMPKVSYGWIIVLITVLLRVIFWPLMAKSTRSMKRMQALAPELKGLQEKYKDDMQKLTQKQWELYRKNKVSPMSGCLPMLFQMPVFFGFFTMLRSAIELRGASFLWAADLSKPDTLFLIPGTALPFNLLPLLMGGAMLWQSHLQPPSPGMDPSQAKMMRYMPLMFLVFLYNYSAGLALYMTVSTLLGVLQTKLTKTNVASAAPAVVSPLTPASKKKK